jgi:hypothetical protein
MAVAISVSRVAVTAMRFLLADNVIVRSSPLSCRHPLDAGNLHYS